MAALMPFVVSITAPTSGGNERAERGTHKIQLLPGRSSGSSLGVFVSSSALTHLQWPTPHSRAHSPRIPPNASRALGRLSSAAPENVANFSMWRPLVDVTARSRRSSVRAATNGDARRNSNMHIERARPLSLSDGSPPFSPRWEGERPARAPFFF